MMIGVMMFVSGTQIPGPGKADELPLSMDKVRAEVHELFMVLDCKVTAPVLASALPVKLALVFMLIDVDAITLPMSDVLVPSVAELGTAHHTLQGSPPTTLAVPDVTSVDPDLKIQTPDPVRVSVPDSVNLPAPSAQ